MSPGVIHSWVIGRDHGWASVVGYGAEMRIARSQVVGDSPERGDHIKVFDAHRDGKFWVADGPVENIGKHHQGSKHETDR